MPFVANEEVESDGTALRHLDELLVQAAWHLDDLNDTRVVISAMRMPLGSLLGRNI